MSPDLPASLARHVSPQTRYLEVPGALRLDSGETLDRVTIAYRTWGKPENASRNAVLVCHALTGSADVDAWWPGIIGEGGAFDPRRDFIVCSNILGSCYGTTGPVSLHPGLNRRYRGSFPRVTVRDMVRLQKSLVDHLRIERLRMVIGPSLGGRQALEWALMYPERVETIVPIGVGGRHSAWCIAMSEAQRAAIFADPNWCDGNYDEGNTPEKGLAAARMMAICSYRSWHSFEQRFGRERRGDAEFEIQSYLRYQGKKINDRFDANSYVRLTQAMNEHDVARGRGNYRDVLQSIRHRALVISIDSDLLYPPHEQELLAQALPNSEYRLVPSSDGHDGFLTESRRLANVISSFKTAEHSLPKLRPQRSEMISAVAE